jgi:hypothetical protein
MIPISAKGPWALSECGRQADAEPTDHDAGGDRSHVFNVTPGRGQSPSPNVFADNASVLHGRLSPRAESRILLKRGRAAPDRGGTMTRIAWGLVLTVGMSIAIAAQGGPPPGKGQMRGGMMHDAQHDADMAVFHALIDNRQKVERTVIRLADGIESVTESDDPAVKNLIQTHVTAMYDRVKEKRPIHVRDPLFREIFANADKIVMKHELTPRGIKVVETSADPYTVKLIQAHADVLDLFIRNGRSEMMKNHDVPARPE